MFGRRSSSRRPGDAVGRRARKERESGGSKHGNQIVQANSVPIGLFHGSATRRAEQPLQSNHLRRRWLASLSPTIITSSQLASGAGAGGPTGSGREGTQSLNSRLVIER